MVPFKYHFVPTFQKSSLVLIKTNGSFPLLRISNIFSYLHLKVLSRYSKHLSFSFLSHLTNVHQRYLRTQRCDHIGIYNHAGGCMYKLASHEVDL